MVSKLPCRRISIDSARDSGTPHLGVAIAETLERIRSPILAEILVLSKRSQPRVEKSVKMAGTLLMRPDPRKLKVKSCC